MRHSHRESWREGIGDAEKPAHFCQNERGDADAAGACGDSVRLFQQNQPAGHRRPDHLAEHRPAAVFEAAN
ncbi:hypothetical protein D3C75_1045640 [compost metagenome]